MIFDHFLCFGNINITYHDHCLQIGKHLFSSLANLNPLHFADFNLLIDFFGLLAGGELQTGQ